jgi:predicted HAD superfamily Cof-like phosphohydrolase
MAIMELQTNETHSKIVDELVTKSLNGNSSLIDFPSPQLSKIIWEVLGLADEKLKSREELVKEFHLLFNHHIGQEPAIPNEKLIELRLYLLLEELIELAIASGKVNFMRSLMITEEHKLTEQYLGGTVINNPSLVGCLDALLDLQYVLSGAILSYGLQDTFDEAFEEVHRSNMSKACQDEITAQMTVEKYKGEGVDCYYVFNELTNNYMVYRTSDKKTLKSINYSPVKLEKFLKNDEEDGGKVVAFR